MSININLLPAELIYNEKEQLKKGWVIKGSVFFILVIVMLTAGAFGLSLFKVSEHTSANERLKQAQFNVQSLNEQEGYLSLIKQHLSIIDKIQNQDQQQISNLKLISSIVPEGTSLSRFSIDSSKKINMSGESDNIDSLEEFLGSLLDSKNEKSASLVSVNNLSLGSQNIARFDLTATLK